MRLHVLVEGESDEALLRGWLPRFLPPGHSFVIIRHRGKGRLPRDPVRVPGIRRAFPQARLQRLNSYVQDSVCNTWELFQSVIGDPIEDKVEWAERMAPHLGTAWKGNDANRSPSFRQLCRGLLKLAGEPAD
jgi:hypothetical protein